MSRLHLTAATLVALAIGTPALANDLYPRTIGSGESVEIDYGPAGQGNLVGGGRVRVIGTGEDTRIQHLDPTFAQTPRQGLVPVTIGSGEGATTVWVPAGTSPSRLALIGADGSLPDESRSRSLAAPLGRLPGRG